MARLFMSNSFATKKQASLKALLFYNMRISEAPF